MKKGPIIQIIFLTTSLFGLIKFHNYNEIQSWKIDIKNKAPVYENDSYPYASMSPPNKVIGYLKVGEEPEVIGVWDGKQFPYWKLRLRSGEKGYIYAPDVEFSREQ